MVDNDPAIWNNPTLGSAANNVSLEQVELQVRENERARKEEREPLTAVRMEEATYPQFAPAGSVPSDKVNAVLVDPSETSTEPVVENIYPTTTQTVNESTDDPYAEESYE